MVLDRVDRLAAVGAIAAEDRRQIGHIHRGRCRGGLNELLQGPAGCGQQLLDAHQFGGLIDQRLIDDHRHILALHRFRQIGVRRRELALREIDQQHVLALGFDGGPRFAGMFKHDRRSLHFRCCGGERSDGGGEVAAFDGGPQPDRPAGASVPRVGMRRFADSAPGELQFSR